MIDGDEATDDDVADASGCGWRQVALPSLSFPLPLSAIHEFRRAEPAGGLRPHALARSSPLVIFFRQEDMTMAGKSWPKLSHSRVARPRQGGPLAGIYRAAREMACQLRQAAFRDEDTTSRTE
jgi:hypothetical protein